MGLIILFAICGGFGFLMYFISKAVLSQVTRDVSTKYYNGPIVSEQEARPLTREELEKYSRWGKESKMRMYAQELAEMLQKGEIEQETFVSRMNDVINTGYFVPLLPKEEEDGERR